MNLTHYLQIIMITMIYHFNIGEYGEKENTTGGSLQRIKIQV